MENNQTAVEYLVKEFSAILGPIKTEAMQDLLLVDAIEKAKQIEKEQIVKAYLEGESDGDHLENSGEIYYKETYGNSNT